MRKKNLGLVVSLAVIISLAVFSPKKVPVVKGYAVTPEELDQGEAIYDRFCRECHDTGRNGAPSPYDFTAWKERLKKGFNGLSRSVTLDCLSGERLSPQAVALATAYMIATSRDRNGRSGPRTKSKKSGGAVSDRPVAGRGS